MRFDPHKVRLNIGKHRKVSFEFLMFWFSLSAVGSSLSDVSLPRDEIHHEPQREIVSLLAAMKLWNKVMFLLEFVILFTGDLPQCMLGYYPPLAYPLAHTHVPSGTPPSGTLPSGTHTPWHTHPRPLAHTPLKADPGIRLISGQYASYCNAFLSL